MTNLHLCGWNYSCTKLIFKISNCYPMKNKYKQPETVKFQLSSTTKKKKKNVQIRLLTWRHSRNQNSFMQIVHIVIRMCCHSLIQQKQKCINATREKKPSPETRFRQRRLRSREFENLTLAFGIPLRVATFLCGIRSGAKLHREDKGRNGRYIKRYK